MVVFLFLEMGNGCVPVNQHFQRGGLDAPHVQGLSIQAGEKPGGVDTDKPVGLCAAQRGSVEAFILAPVFQLVKALPDSRRFH